MNDNVWWFMTENENVAGQYIYYYYCWILSYKFLIINWILHKFNSSSLSHCTHTFDFNMTLSFCSVLIISLAFKNSSERFCREVCLLTRTASLSARFSSKRDYDTQINVVTHKYLKNQLSFISVLHNFTLDWIMKRTIKYNRQCKDKVLQHNTYTMGQGVSPTAA